MKLTRHEVARLKEQIKQLSSSGSTEEVKILATALRILLQDY